MGNNHLWSLGYIIRGGVARAITTCFFYNILEVIYEQQETGDASPE